MVWVGGDFCHMGWVKFGERGVENAGRGLLLWREAGVFNIAGGRARGAEAADSRDIHKRTGLITITICTYK